MVRTTLLDCYRWEFSRVVLVQRRGMPPTVWKRKNHARASSTVDGGDVRGGGGLLGRVGCWPHATWCRQQQRRCVIWRWRRRRLEPRSTRCLAAEAVAGSGGGGGDSGGGVWRRRRGREAAAAWSGGDGGGWRLRRPLDKFSFVFLQQTAPIKLTAITVL
jgi:hypothetical protein